MGTEGYPMTVTGTGKGEHRPVVHGVSTPVSPFGGSRERNAQPAAALEQVLG